MDGHLCLIGMWLGEDRRTNTIKTRARKRLDDVAEMYSNYSTLNDGHDWEDLSVCSIKESTSVHGRVNFNLGFFNEL